MFLNSSLTEKSFLEQYWQKKPYLFRQGFQSFKSPLTPDELASLACDADIESRLIEENSVNGPWQVQHGPFDEAVFQTLPEKNWTLLVQDVDKHLPELRALLSPFLFIPDWRRDDLMISFAPEGGSVGPHTDGYDVFLIQAMGKRRWEISDRPIEQPALLEGLDIKVMSDFEANQTWVLEPGDILYLPPHYAHHGVALNDCMTFSVGFRSPTTHELFDSYLHNLVENQVGQTHYADPDLMLNASSTEIDSAAKARFKAMLIDTIQHSDDILSEAIGKLLTETKPTVELLAQDLITDEEIDFQIDEQFQHDQHLVRNRYIRTAWTRTNEGIQVFVAGEVFTVSTVLIDVIELLLDADQLTMTDWQRLKHYDVQPLLEALLSHGAWYWQAS